MQQGIHDSCKGEEVKGDLEEGRRDCMPSLQLDSHIENAVTEMGHACPHAPAAMAGALIREKRGELVSGTDCHIQDASCDVSDSEDDENEVRMVLAPGPWERRIQEIAAQGQKPKRLIQKQSGEGRRLMGRSTGTTRNAYHGQKAQPQHVADEPEDSDSESSQDAWLPPIDD